MKKNKNLQKDCRNNEASKSANANTSMNKNTSANKQANTSSNFDEQ